VTVAVATCPTCGARLERGAVECAYCHSSLIWDGATPPAPRRSVEEAVTLWGRSIFGAPRNLGRLVEAVEVKDEVLERLFTTVVRRDVQEVRGRGPSGRTMPARVDARTIDPFVISPEQLRDASQHVTTCGVCGGSGTGVCHACGGSGRARCGNCQGSGKERRQYKTTTRLVKCTVCRGGGTVACGGCGARGTVGCDGCGATGNQLAWLTYGQTNRAMLFVTDSPVVGGHRQLSEQRNLVLSDLTAFGVAAKIEASAALPEGGDAPAALLRTHRIDARLERVTSQQYIKIAVVRRDATFEMCGSSGTLVMSGGDLTGSTGPSALGPIRKRQVLWILGFVVAFWLSMLLLAGRHRLPYFSTANSLIALLTMAALGLTIPALGVVLRQWRRGFRLRGFAGFEKALVGATALLFVAAIAISKLSQPRVGEVAEALASKDIARARVVLNALLAAQNRAPQVADAEDNVELAEAATQPLAAKLDLLDGVAARKGSKASDAASRARQERLAVISGHLKDQKPALALKAIALWFPAGAVADNEIAELRAEAEQQVFAACSDPACRFAAASRINAAAPKPERSAQLATAKGDLLGALEFPQVPGEAVATRLSRLRALAVVATAAHDAGKSDADVAAAADKAVAFAQTERSHVALMGAQEPAIAELIGPLTRKTDAISYVEADSRDIFVVFDAQRRCRGIYAVGAQPSSRTIADGVASAILSQAVGHAASLKPPTGSSTTSRWVESGVAVVGRWRSSGLVELRIGDAAP
jgi:hypothetical protein